MKMELNLMGETPDGSLNPGSLSILIEAKSFV